MKKLLQNIESLIDNITVTDRQEENIQGSVSNLTNTLLKDDSNLYVERVFLNGSYERETIIRPLKDIDLFAVLDKEKYQDEYFQLPSPQSVLTKLKNYLNDQHDYKDKVKQDRPCVTVKLSDKDFDVLPCFKVSEGMYEIPNYDLQSWVLTNPEVHTQSLNQINEYRGNNDVKKIVKAIKYWNRENGKHLPSYHIEEVAISVFNINSFENLEEGIYTWFEKYSFNALPQKFRSTNESDQAQNKINKAFKKLEEAREKLDEEKESDAISLWKEVFGNEFPTANIEEAKQLARALAEGTLKISPSGALSSNEGRKTKPLEGGFYGSNL